MNQQQVLDWKQGFDRAREIECERIRHEPLDLKRSIHLALSLIEFCRKQEGWSYGLQDPLRMREIEDVRRRWAQLKKGCQP